MNYKLVVGIAVVVACLLAVPTVTSGADDGAALYKSKCASCHGAGGQGKPAMKAPALKGTTLSSDDIVKQLTAGKADSKAPHNKAMAGLNEAQAKAVAEFVKTLK